MKIRANAKINLNLGICGKREDGYHLIDTVMHSISLYDLININKADKITVECSNKEISQEDNIAFKAAKLFFENTEICGGCRIEIEKNIPTCAGLGGGSADAAAVLCGLNRLYDAKLTDDELCKLAVELGADVPFFIKGGCQRAQGIGEILESHTPLKRGYFVLAKADKKPSTAEMYRIIDSNEPVEVDSEVVLKYIARNDLIKLSKNLYNAFSVVWHSSNIRQKLCDFSPNMYNSFSKVWHNTRIRKRLGNLPLAISLTGSGPTWFALFYRLKNAKKMKRYLEEQNIECYVVTPEKVALEFE